VIPNLKDLQDEIPNDPRFDPWIFSGISQADPQESVGISQSLWGFVSMQFRVSRFEFRKRVTGRWSLVAGENTLGIRRDAKNRCTTFTTFTRVFAFRSLSSEHCNLQRSPTFTTFIARVSNHWSLVAGRCQKQKSNRAPTCTTCTTFTRVFLSSSLQTIRRVATFTPTCTTCTFSATYQARSLVGIQL
jgi:hypothetical protein